MILQLPIYCVLRENLRRMKQEYADDIGAQQNSDENIDEKEIKRSTPGFDRSLMTSIYFSLTLSLMAFVYII